MDRKFYEKIWVRKFFLIVLFYLGICCSTIAADITWDGSSSNDWDTGANWSGNAVPTAADNVTIPDVATDPTISIVTTALCLNLTINSGAVLTNDALDGLGYLDIYGNFINNGTFNHSGTALTFMNGTTKTLGGTGTFTTTEIDLFLGSSTTLSSNLTLLNLLMDNSAATTLNLSSYYLTVTGDFYQEGTINFNTGTLEVQGYVVNGVAARWNCNTGLFYENLGFSETWIAGYTFYDFKVNCPGFTYSIGANLTVTRDLIITAGTLAVDSYTLNIGRNLTNTGTLSATSGRVNFNGGAAQTISGAGTTTFHDVTIANTSGDVALSTNASVTGTLTMSSGDLVIATGNNLTIIDVDDPGISGGSASTMIVTSGTATVIKNYSSTVAIPFPLGNGTLYKPITITPSANTASNWTVNYKRSAYSDLTVTGGLHHVSHGEYWTVVQSVNLNSTIQIPWTSSDGVTDYTLLQVAKYNGADWAGIASSPSGTNTSGDLPTTAATTIGTSTSYWTTGTTSNVNTLPIELISFTGTKDGSNNSLFWTTETELNNDFFTIEKTTDGQNYEIVGTIDGVGSSNQLLEYTLTDSDVRQFLNYYRLKQTDFDGKYTYSNVIAIDNRPSSSKEISLITNILGQEVNEYYRGVVIIVYTDGTSIKIIQ